MLDLKLSKSTTLYKHKKLSIASKQLDVDKQKAYYKQNPRQISVTSLGKGNSMKLRKLFLESEAC